MLVFSKELRSLISVMKFKMFYLVFFDSLLAKPPKYVLF